MIRSFPLSRAGKSAKPPRIIEPLTSHRRATDQPHAASTLAKTFSEHH